MGQPRVVVAARVSPELNAKLEGGYAAAGFKSKSAWAEAIIEQALGSHQPEEAQPQLGQDPLHSPSRDIEESQPRSPAAVSASRNVAPQISEEAIEARVKKLALRLNMDKFRLRRMAVNQLEQEARRG